LRRAAAAARLKDDPDYAGALIIAADTVVGVGRRVLAKPATVEEAAGCLSLLSGRSHRVYTGLAFVTAKGAVRRRLVETRVRFKRLSREDIDAYLASDQWRDKAGGYAIQGIAGAFAIKLIGSYSNVVGLPLYETMSLLTGEGYPVHFNWLGGAST
jgi:septum formation protein